MQAEVIISGYYLNIGRTPLTSRRAPRRQYRGGAGTGRRRGPGSIGRLAKEQKDREACVTKVVTYSVGADANLTSLLVLDEPGPATALDTSKSSVHLVLELIEAAVGGVNGLGQGARRGLTTAGVLGSQVLPEEGVVQVATTVEVDSGLEGNLGRDVTLGLGLLELLNGVVVVGDIGVMVVLVVQLHDLAGDGRLESTIVV